MSEDSKTVRLQHENIGMLDSPSAQADRLRRSGQLALFGAMNAIENMTESLLPHGEQKLQIAE